jgi:hypothetical protein
MIAEDKGNERRQTKVPFLVFRKRRGLLKIEK